MLQGSIKVAKDRMTKRNRDNELGKQSAKRMKILWKQSFLKIKIPICLTLILFAIYLNKNNYLFIFNEYYVTEIVSGTHVHSLNLLGFILIPIVNRFFLNFSYFSEEYSHSILRFLSFILQSSVMLPLVFRPHSVVI